MRLVVVESPFGAKTDEEIEENIRYARMALRDCILRGESPIASHLLLTQPGVLDDKDPDERALGIAAGLEWVVRAHASVVYIDRGISEGMWKGITHAKLLGVPVEERRIPGYAAKEAA